MMIHADFELYQLFSYLSETFKHFPLTPPSTGQHRHSPHDENQGSLPAVGAMATSRSKEGYRTGNLGRVHSSTGVHRTHNTGKQSGPQNPQHWDAKGVQNRQQRQPMDAERRGGVLADVGAGVEERIA